jgi:hypothetical protein
MNKRIKALWVKALRSGKYKQGCGQLKTSRGFCCLGVLTDLYNKEVIMPKLIKSGGWETDNTPTLVAHPSDFGLSEKVKEWAGLEDDIPDVKLDKNGWDTKSLAQLNDGSEIRKHSFKEIAKLIEKSL